MSSTSSQTKTCITCNIEKPLSEFSLHNVNKKPRNQCKQCLKISRSKLKLRSKVTPSEKTCTKCNKTFPCTSEYFNIYTLSPNGFSS